MKKNSEMVQRALIYREKRLAKIMDTRDLS